MRAREYCLVERCIQDGIMMGWNRAHKHTDNPTKEAVLENIGQAIMLELNEWFMFEDIDYEGQDNW